MHTDIFTYFTVPAITNRSELLYSAEEWVRIELVLETAGPVAVSTRQSVTPVLSGKGVLLEPDGEPLKFIMPRGDRLFIAAESVNRVKVIIEPIPWLEQIYQTLTQGFGSLRGLLGGALRRIPALRSVVPEKEVPDCPPKIKVPNLAALKKRRR